MIRVQRLSVHNAAELSRIVNLEPWGREFILGVDEKLEITAWPGEGDTGLRLACPGLAMIGAQRLMSQGYRQLALLSFWFPSILACLLLSGPGRPTVPSFHALAFVCVAWAWGIHSMALHGAGS